MVPLHAWRALGQLQAIGAISTLIDQLFRIDKYDDDWVSEDLPTVFSLIGSTAIPELSKYLSSTNHSEFAQLCAADSLAKIGVSHPESRLQCIAAIENKLQRFKENVGYFNGSLIFN
ncbi:MAG: hypothetical protein Q9M28_08440 [Mariprofundaceae bacterium]|nr:hypothetical protein [Mariprofundaceae bacterium]